MARDTQSTHASLGKSLATHDYVRLRFEPRPGDGFYLTLSDLVLAWRKAANHLAGTCPRIIDLGCGGSPYRSLFGDAACYHRADIEGTPDLAFTMDARTSCTGAEGGRYDVVVSSQVLEHVESPALYLQEARRLLRAGGTLLLSTHGTYEDHPCPGDYWRWTGQGLEKQLDSAGFELEDMLYLTTGLRAALVLLEINTPRLGMGHWFTRAVTALPAALWESKLVRGTWHRVVDKLTARNRIVSRQQPYSGVYLILLAVAKKKP
jgi:SAM-dependent methyltransferase